MTFPKGEDLFAAILFCAAATIVWGGWVAVLGFARSFTPWDGVEIQPLPNQIRPLGVKPGQHRMTCSDDEAAN